MAALTERRPATHVVAELGGELSRDTVTIAAGQVLPAGAVLGEVLASGEYAAFDPAATDGTEVAAGILYEAVDAASGPRPAVIHTWTCAVQADRLVWKAGLTEADHVAALSTLALRGVRAR
jgi:hypothetical protein